MADLRTEKSTVFSQEDRVAPSAQGDAGAQSSPAPERTVVDIPASSPASFPQPCATTVPSSDIASALSPAPAPEAPPIVPVVQDNAEAGDAEVADLERENTRVDAAAYTDAEFVHPADMADHLENLSLEKQVSTLRRMPKEEAAEALAELDENMAVDVLENLDDDVAAQIIAEMSPDDAADVLDELDADRRDALLGRLTRESSEELRSLLNFDPDSAGGVMNTELILLEKNFTADEAIAHIRSEMADKESPYYAYVVDAQHVLVGVLSLRDLMLARPGTVVGDAVAGQSVVSVTYDTDKREVASLLSHYNYMAMPVVDNEGHVLHFGTLPQYVPDLAMELLDWVKNSDVHMLIRSCVFHYEFELIHPFSDGNGRVGRLWHTLLLSKWNPAFAWLPVESIIHDRQQEYYDAINASNDAGESTVFIEFILSAIKAALMDAINMSNEMSDGKVDKITLRWNKIQEYLKTHPFIMNADVRALCGVSAATANRILASIVADGKLVKRYECGHWVYKLTYIN